MEKNIIVTGTDIMNTAAISMAVVPAVADAIAVRDAIAVVPAVVDMDMVRAIIVGVDIKRAGAGS